MEKFDVNHSSYFPAISFVDPLSFIVSVSTCNRIGLFLIPKIHHRKPAKPVFVCVNQTRGYQRVSAIRYQNIYRVQIPVFPVKAWPVLVFV